MIVLFSIQRRSRQTAACLLGFAAIGIQGQAVGQAALQDAREADPRTVLRLIDDRANCGRWLLARAPEHPGGPGRLVLVARQGAQVSVDGVKPRLQTPSPESLVPVIRAGDPLIVEVHTAAADVRLEGVALGPARLGAALQVRLKFSGQLVRATASGPGRATPAAMPEAWQ
jgi:hypothetical protein